MSTSDDFVKESLLRCASGEAAPGLRGKVLGEVNRELRARRRDRQFARAAGVVMLMALSGNLIVGQHELVRSTRWFPSRVHQLARSDEPATEESEYADSSSGKLFDYLMAAYEPSGVFFRSAHPRRSQASQVHLWIEDISGPEGET